ncbi:MAG: hypothetical protein ACREJ0_15440 [Geminicoccaceae bacterium]
MPARESTGPKLERQPIRKIGIVLYALFMTFLQSHYLTAQLYRDSEYFFGVWLGVSDAEVLSRLLLAFCANVGLLLSPFVGAPGRALRLLILLSLAFGAILATISLVHIFSIHAFHPFWPSRPIDGIYIGMFIDHLVIYAIDLFAIYLYLSRLKHLHTFKTRELREESQ